MSESADDISKVQNEILDIFAKLFFGKAMSNKKMNDFFKIANSFSEDKKFSMSPVPNNREVTLTSNLDGKAYNCKTREEIEQAASEIINKTNHYDTLLTNIQPYKNSNGLEVNKSDYFTPKIFNDLGGEDSDIFKNTKSIQITENEHNNEKNVILNFIQDASHRYDGLIVRPYSDTDYMVGLRIKKEDHFQFFLSPKEELEKNVMDATFFNEYSYLLNKRTGYEYNENEVDKEKLKQAGIKWSDLSETQKIDLLKGKEISSMAITGIDNKGKKVYSKGHLKLSRIDANSAIVLFRPESKIGLKKDFAVKR
jgi:hypothetical protein